MDKLLSSFFKLIIIQKHFSYQCYSYYVMFGSLSQIKTFAE